MTRFRCVGAACEDDCCTGWAIPVDEPHFVALQQKFADALAPLPQPTRGKHGLMVLRPDLRCSMLDGDKLCRIHKQEGEALLPDTCAMYPRTVGVVEGRRELAGALSCPEAARLAFAGGDALDPVTIDPALVPRASFARGLRPQAPYEQCLDGARGAMHQLLTARAFPVASRLFFVAWVAHQTEAIFRRDLAFDPRQVAGAFQLAGRPEVQQQLDGHFAGAVVEDPFAMTVVTQVLEANREGALPAFVRLLDGVRVRYGGERDAARLWAAHRARAAAHGDALDGYLEAFAKNVAFKDWFTEQPSFVAWAHGLFVRVALVRFLLVAHPLVETAPERAAVEVVYSLSRTLEHDEAPMARVLDALEAQGMRTLAHAVSLLKV